VSAYDLPKSALIGGVEYEIRSDYRAVLDIIEVMSDPEISDEDRTNLTLTIFYPAYMDMPYEVLRDAVEYMIWFVGGGEDRKSAKRKPRVMDWSQDFKLIVTPINRVLGYEVRSVDYLHWWSFLAAYYEVGDCLFAEVVNIRKKLAEGRKLEKHERKFYNENRDLVTIRRGETQEELAILDEWMGGVPNGAE
jgi:hypothetical protein